MDKNLDDNKENIPIIVIYSIEPQMMLGASYELPLPRLPSWSGGSLKVYI